MEDKCVCVYFTVQVVERMIIVFLRISLHVAEWTISVFLRISLYR